MAGSTTVVAPPAPVAATVASVVKPVTSISIAATEAIKNFTLPPGYHLELVLSEPDIAEPVMVAFDGNGRMYVAEMRTYMQNIDGKNELERTSRVSMHEDTDGDGIMDRHTIFADHLLLPRTLLTLDDRVIIGETNTNDLYCYRDTNGDGVADEKTLWFAGGARGGNLEHQPNGLLWALDNGLYSTYDPYRLRFTDGKVVKEEIPENQGQWGLTQDDFGKVWFVNAGQEIGPVHFQQHILYGKFSIPGERSGDYKEVWPLLSSPDIQGGKFQLRENGTLNHFTSTCGQDIFRGDRLPLDLRGDLLFAEPVGRLIRRTKITVNDGITHLANAYDQSEFLRTKDPLFRPVNMVTAPDGTLYIVDMYRGIIQEGQWTREGSYLREQIEKLDLAKEIGRGRIYRLVHDDFKPGPQPRMLDETPAQWVQHLSHPNGWWRDTAQKLLILKGDKSVVPALTTLAATSPDPKARIHALWTLEGLGEMTEPLVTAALHDPDNEVKKAGIRLSEPLLKEMKRGDAPLLVELKAQLQDNDPGVVIQAMLSLKRGAVPEARELAKTTAAASASTGVYAINEQLWKEDQPEDPFLPALLGPVGLKSYRAGRTFYNSLCFACHGADGKGTPNGPGKTLAPALSHAEQILGGKEVAIEIVLHGLEGMVNGTDYGAPMISMASYSDEQLANVLTYIRNSFGNRSDEVRAPDVAQSRERFQDRKRFWTMAELEALHPELKIPAERFEHRSAWKLSASHAPETAALAVDERAETCYLTGSTPYPGLWFQVELPQRSAIRTIVMDSAGTAESYPLSYEVRVSDDGQNWGAPVAAGHGETTTQIHLTGEVRAKFVRIAITEKDGWQKWAIHNLDFFGEEN